MPFHQPDRIRYYTFDSFDSAGVKHAVFTRQGGVSPEPWASLNVGGLRGDDPQRVIQNRVLSFEVCGRNPESVYDVWQVHSADVLCTRSHRPSNVPHRKADAILTDRPEVTLFMRFGDCVPILLVDPIQRVVGVVHAGWIGTVKGILSETIRVMQSEFFTSPGDVLAGIGPSIARHHYPVGQEVVELAYRSFGEDAKGLISQDGEVYHFDLWEANKLLLANAGVRQIEISGICTACNLEDWYSHRAERGKTGRFGALITIGD
jgi:polyphenol oxidase